jgi:hypothetical protein
VRRQERQPLDVTRARAIARDLGFGRALVSSLAIAIDLARAVDSALCREKALAEALRDDPGVARLRAVARDEALGCTRALARAGAHACAHNRLQEVDGLDGVVARVLTRALEHDPAVARDLLRDLAQACGKGSARARQRALILPGTSGRVLAHAERNLAVTCMQALDLARNLGCSREQRWQGWMLAQLARLFPLEERARFDEEHAANLAYSESRTARIAYLLGLLVSLPAIAGRRSLPHDQCRTIAWVWRTLNGAT